VVWPHETMGDMIAVYQLLHKQLNIDTSNLFTAATTTITRGHNLKLFKFPATSRVRSNFFSIRSINHWNNLPDYIINPYLISRNCWIVIILITCTVIYTVNSFLLYWSGFTGFSLLTYISNNNYIANQV